MSHVYEVGPVFIRAIEDARPEARRLARQIGRPVTIFKCTLNSALAPKELLLAALNRSSWATERVALETYRPRAGGERGTVPMAAFKAMALGEDATVELGQFPPEHDEDEDDGTSDLADEGRET